MFNSDKQIQFEFTPNIFNYFNYIMVLKSYTLLFLEAIYM